MPIEIIIGSIENAPQLFECGRRAFESNLLEKAMFPITNESVEDLEKFREFRIQRLTKRLSKSGCHVFVAIDKEVEDGNRVLGYSVWYEELIRNSSDGKKEMSVAKDGSEEVELESINSKLIERVGRIIEEAREEYLKGLEGDLTMLAIDPGFGGRGIASQLVKMGVDQAQKALLPAYTMSSPAAVRVYANQGFKELGKKKILEDGSYYLTAFLRMAEPTADF